MGRGTQIVISAYEFIEQVRAGTHTPLRHKLFNTLVQTHFGYYCSCSSSLYMYGINTNVL